MYVVAITNRKGGTGKTTTAVNLAAQWGSQGYKTLLIDLDTQGHAAIGVGCRQFRQHSESIQQLFQQSAASLSQLIIQTPIKNVWLAPADTEFESTKFDVSILRQALSTDVIKQSYQRIIIDTPPTLDSLLISGLVAADGVIVPFVPHHLAEVGVKQLAKLFYQVATQYNSNLLLLGLLPVMYDRHIKLHQRVIQALGKQFGQQRILRGIRSNIKLAEAFESGLPIAEFAPKSTGNMDYQLMAEEVGLLFN